MRCRARGVMKDPMVQYFAILFLAFAGIICIYFAITATFPRMWIIVQALSAGALIVSPVVAVVLALRKGDHR